MAKAIVLAFLFLLGITSVYLQGIDNAEIMETVHSRRAPDDPGQRVAAERAGHALESATWTVLSRRDLPLAREGESDR
jgi:hypothetical protein